MLCALEKLTLHFSLLVRGWGGWGRPLLGVKRSLLQVRGGSSPTGSARQAPRTHCPSLLVQCHWEEPWGLRLFRTWGPGGQEPSFPRGWGAAPYPRSWWLGPSATLAADLHWVPGGFRVTWA